MRTEVRYFSRGGATKKLADAIGRAVGAEAKSVEVPLDQYADVVFLGASVYGGKPDPAVVNFIGANAKNIGKIVVFGSACTGKSTHAAIKSAAAGNAVKTAEMFFQCKGAIPVHEQRPPQRPGLRGRGGVCQKTDQAARGDLIWPIRDTKR